MFQPPPFRADHVGSLLRPAGLLELRRQVERGDATPDALAEAENIAIAEAVALQARVGLKLATDGEFRRRSYHSYFYRQLGDVIPDAIGGGASAGGRGAQPQAVINSKLRWTHPIHVDDFRLLRSLTRAVPKITIPGPCALHFRGGDAVVTATAYDDVDDFWDDVVAAFRSELEALAAAGCTYVQVDETAFAKFGDPDVQAELAARGDHWSALIDKYIAVTNRVLDGLPPALHVACIYAAAIVAANGIRREATTPSPSGCSTILPSSPTSSNMTRRAPATSRHCVSSRRERRLCSG